MSNTMQQDFRFVPISQNNKIQETVKLSITILKKTNYKLTLKMNYITCLKQ